MTGFLDPELTTIAFCWRLERRDGACLGFTGHDRALTIGGLAYRAAPGMVPSAITLSDGFDADSLDIAGALTSDAVTAADLSAGRWDGAELRLFMVDWTDAEGSQALLARGQLGEVSLSGTGFEAELRGPTALLERAVVEQTSPECRAQLGDRRCRMDMAGRIQATRIAAVAGDDSLDLAEGSGATNAYAYGRLRWISGANCGLESEVVASDGLRLTLREPPHAPAAVGDRVEVHEGCDKSFGTCTARFANAANFRGEPHLPGMDLLTRYPGV